MKSKKKRDKKIHRPNSNVSKGKQLNRWWWCHRTKTKSAQNCVLHKIKVNIYIFFLYCFVCEKNQRVVSERVRGFQILFSICYCCLIQKKKFFLLISYCVVFLCVCVSSSKQLTENPVFFIVHRQKHALCASQWNLKIKPHNNT